MIIKERKLPEYYHFNIEIKNEYGGFYSTFRDTLGNALPSYKEKLTPAQWKKASQYLTRELRPFIGYSYDVKPEYKKVAVYKIK
jgi:hypothetical protein